MVRPDVDRPRRPSLVWGVGALLLFIVLTVLVAARWDPVFRLDSSAHDALMAYGRTHANWVNVMQQVTHLGDTVTLVFIDAVLVVLCLARRRWRAAVLVAGIAALAWLVRIGVRDLVGRPRPSDGFWSETQASFPSGHTTNSTVTVGLILLVCWPLLRRTGRVVVAGLAILYAVGVGLSRVAGGVHWPSDVVGGWLLGAGIVATAAALGVAERARVRSEAVESVV